jgi:Antirestriction protein (ArdA)
MTTLHATPYNLDIKGFYFESEDEFITKMEGLTDKYGIPVEEFEIQFIDGDDDELFEAAGITQATLSIWFDDIELLTNYQKLGLFFLLDIGRGLECALENYDDASIQEGDLEDAAAQLFDECYAHDIPESLRYYIDYEKFAQDVKLGGDMVEFEYNGTTYTCTNANCL